MSQTLKEIAESLQGATHKTKAVAEKTSDVKVQLIYAFNGTGKTRLSREFKNLIAPNNIDEDDDSGIEETELAQKNILYYSAFTEDLFYWDNDLDNDEQRKLKIHTNAFTKWVFEDQGQDQNVITNFQHYTDEKLTPHFNQDFSEVTFSFERGNEEKEDNIKISKGEQYLRHYAAIFSLWILPSIGTINNACSILITCSLSTSILNASLA